MTQTVRIFIVADRRYYLESLVLAFGFDPLVRVSGAECDPENAFKGIGDNPPDITIIDFNSPSALHLTKRITLGFPDVKIIVLGDTETEYNVLQCIEVGANGYISKDASLTDLRTAVQMVFRGETPCSTRLAFCLFSRLCELSTSSLLADNLLTTAILTAREKEVLRLVAEGRGNKEIADLLFVSVYTVKNHVHSILGKLHLPHRFAAASYAWAHFDQSGGWRRNGVTSTH